VVFLESGPGLYRNPQDAPGQVVQDQQTGLLPFQPSLGLLGVTLGAVPIRARAIAAVLVPAAITALEIVSKVGRAAMLDPGHGFQLPWRKLVMGSERLTVEAENVRHLQQEPLKGTDDLVNGL
jgi:hypothetical protein